MEEYEPLQMRVIMFESRDVIASSDETPIYPD